MNDRIKYAFQSPNNLSESDIEMLSKLMAKDAKKREQNMRHICETGSCSRRESERQSALRLKRIDRDKLKSAWPV